METPSFSSTTQNRGKAPSLLPPGENGAPEGRQLQLLGIDFRAFWGVGSPHLSKAPLTRRGVLKKTKRGGLSPAQTSNW